RRPRRPVLRRVAAIAALAGSGCEAGGQDVPRRCQPHQSEARLTQRLALVDEPDIVDRDGAIGQMCEQVADPYLLVQRPPHVRADELRPTPAVALGRQNLSGLGRKTSLDHYPPRKQLGRPPRSEERRGGTERIVRWMAHLQKKMMEHS